MANSEEMFDDLLNKKESYFVPSSKPKTSGKPKNAPNVRGEFYGHLQNASMKEVSWERDGDKFKAVVYNYEFVVHKANKSQEYTYTHWESKDPMKSSGKDYIGRSYRNNGIFRFLEPEDGDDFVSNSDGNSSYFRFCETLGVDIDKKVVQVDGQDVEVQVLPMLLADDINGKPAIAVVDKGKPYSNKDGQKRTPYVVKFIKEWKDGEIQDADIPF